MQRQAKTDPPAWALENLRTDRGLMLDFDSRPYLIAPWRDERPEQVCVACAQSGKTLLYLGKTWHRLMHPRDPAFTPTAIYTFPTATDVSEFSRARAKKMIQASPLLSEEIADLDAVDVKQGKSGWTTYFRGTKTERAALSIPAGMLVHDELDRSQPDTLQMYGDRTRDSADPHKYVFSTPTVPGFGISAQWARSDQREWVWACADCGKEQVFAPMDKSVKWRDSLDLDTVVFRCNTCQSPVSDTAVLAGRWVPFAPGSTIAGYHITGIMPARSTAAALCKAYAEAEFPELFAQGHIGVPETSGQSQITPDLIAFGDWPNTLHHDGPLFAGIDQGKKLDFVAGDAEGKIVAVHRFDDWSQVESAMRTLNVRCLVGDSQPEPRPLQAMVAKFPNRVVLADYSLNALVSDAWFVRDPKAPHVRIHRTAGLDYGSERIIGGERGQDLWPQLPMDERRVLEAHLCASQRTVEKDVHGVLRGVWIETGDDHLRHAHLYYMVATRSVTPPQQSRTIRLVERSYIGQL